MKYLMCLVVLVLALLMSGVASADGPNYGGLTLRQWRDVALAYEYTDFYGFRDQDRDDFLRMLYRETLFGYDDTGDCTTLPNGNIYCLSIGPAQFHEFGVWWSTPCARLGLAARWDHDANIGCAAWAWSHGYAAHWRPWEHPAGRWPAVVPEDPREWLWGQAHYPGRD